MSMLLLPSQFLCLCTDGMQSVELVHDNAASPAVSLTCCSPNADVPALRPIKDMKRHTNHKRHPKPKKRQPAAATMKEDHRVLQLPQNLCQPNPPQRRRRRSLSGIKRPLFSCRSLRVERRHETIETSPPTPPVRRWSISTPTIPRVSPPTLCCLYDTAKESSLDSSPRRPVRRISNNNTEKISNALDLIDLMDSDFSDSDDDEVTPNQSCSVSS